jgi:hypothetical protein
MNRYMLVGVSVVALVASFSPELRSQALERSLYVSMLDKSGVPVPNMGPADFVVREDNVAREVLRVVPASEPMQIAILVDNSTAAGPMIQQIRRALPPFVEAMAMPNPAGRRNEIALVTLAARPTILAEYTSDPEPLKKAVDRVWEDAVLNGYYLLDGIIEISQGFRVREAPRPVIVAIITEGPELSHRDPTQVLNPLRDSGAALHVITLGPPSSGVENEVIDRNRVIDEGPRTSGGTRSQLLAASALPAKLLQLADVLKSTYRVTYARPDSLIPPERITVAARRSDLTAHGRPVRESQAKQ